MSCLKCREKSLQADCCGCQKLIAGEYLAKKPKNGFKVKLVKIDDNKVFEGTVVMVSPIGLALKSNVPEGKYWLKVLGNLVLLVTPLQSKGKPPYQSFDIISIKKAGQEKERLDSDDFKMITQSNEDIILQLTENLPPETKSIIRERLKEDVQKSKLLDALNIGGVLKYDRGVIKILSKENQFTLSRDFIRDFFLKSLRERSYIQDTVIDENGEKIYNLHVMPLENQLAGMVAIDVTEIVAAERKNKERELEIYRDVLWAVTGGKLKLVNENELAAEVGNGEIIAKAAVEKADDIGIARDMVRKSLKDLNLNPFEGTHVLISVSEAVTNAIKYAGRCDVSVKVNPAKVSIIVADKGKGINFGKLPKVTLMKSYSESSTFSLGDGFTLMLRFTDRLVIKTNGSGTTLILEKELQKRGE